LRNALYVVQAGLDKVSSQRLTLWFRSHAAGTRRVPAPSHLAQRDVAKTSFSKPVALLAPGAEPTYKATFAWPTCRFRGNLTANRQPKKYTRFSWFSQGPSRWDLWKKLFIYYNLHEA